MVQPLMVLVRKLYKVAHYMICGHGIQDSHAAMN